MPTSVEPKTMDPEAELSNAQRLFKKLAPMCSVAKRALGIPQLATQEKQLEILSNELKETLLCINLASKGQHAVRDNYVKTNMGKTIVEYEELELELRDEKVQLTELDCLNYLAKKQVQDTMKIVHTEAEELELIEASKKRLRRMENRLEMATNRFCGINYQNLFVRDEIRRYLTERANFNVQWHRIIGKLVKGKEFLMDIFDIASMAFTERDEFCRKLEALKWKGLYQLNRDISDMQAFEGDLNHLAKLEEFLRYKGTQRICEADEKEEAKHQEELKRCEKMIAHYDAVLEEIFQYTGLDSNKNISALFKTREINNFSIFLLLCEELQESIILRRDTEMIRQLIVDQRDWIDAREDREEKRIQEMTLTLEEIHQCTSNMGDQAEENENTLKMVLHGVDELFKLVKCDSTPLLTLLGDHKRITKWNVMSFLKILETEVKSLIEIAYGSVKPPAPTPKVRKPGLPPPPPSAKLVADPVIEIVHPNDIEALVPYHPCAYCVEDYIVNLVYEIPAIPADNEYVQGIFHLEEPNTKFGIYTLTIPAKRHPYRSGKKD